eukprot:gene19377-21026_t
MKIFSLLLSTAILSANADDGFVKDDQEEAPKSKSPTIRSADGNVLFESPGGFCFGVGGMPSGFAQYKGDQGEVGPAGPEGPAGRDGIQGNDGKAGKDYDPTDSSTLTLGVVRDPVFALGISVSSNPAARIMGPTGAPKDREVMVGGIGLAQFHSFTNEIFRCTFKDVDDSDKNKTSALVGVVGTKDARSGAVQYTVPCV